MFEKSPRLCLLEALIALTPKEIETQTLNAFLSERQRLLTALSAETTPWHPLEYRLLADHQAEVQALIEKLEITQREIGMQLAALTRSARRGQAWYGGKIDRQA